MISGYKFWLALGDLACGVWGISNTHPGLELMFSVDFCNFSFRIQVTDRCLQDEVGISNAGAWIRIKNQMFRLC